jgi:ABC-type branched-subunit amino acid transport system substrate-binding protein
MPFRCHRPSVFLLFLLVTIILRTSSANNKQQSPPSIVWILGLFPNYRGNDNIDRSGIQRKASFLLAIDEINNSTEILPNTTIKFGIGDSRRSANIAVEAAANLVERLKEKTAGKMPIAIIGPASSGPTQLVHRLCNGYKLAEVGYSATSPSLSNSKEYKYFARLPPSDSFQVVVLADLIKNVVGVENFITIAGPDLYSTSGITALVDIVPSGTIIKQYNMIVATNEDTIDITKLESMLFEIISRKCNVVAVFAQASHYKTLFETAAALGLYGDNRIKWVVSETFLQYFLQYKDNLSTAVKRTIHGVYMAEIENGKNLDSSVSQYPHLNNLWKKRVSTGTSDVKLENDDGTASSSYCSDETDGLGNFIWRLDHDFAPETSMRCTGFSFKHNSVVEYGGYTPFVYDGTWAIAHALHNYLYVKQGPNNTAAFPTFEDRINYYNELLQVNFKGATGTVKFFSNGDRSTNEIFYNILQVQYTMTASGSESIDYNSAIQTLVPIGTFLNGVFKANNNSNHNYGNNNGNNKKDDEAVAICEVGYKDQTGSKNTAPAVILIEIVLSFGFLAMLSIGVAIVNYVKHKKKEKELHLEVKKSKRKSFHNKVTKLKELKNELKAKLAEELMIQISVGTIELIDLITDWVAYSEDSLEGNAIVHSMYYIAMLVATCCSILAMYYRIDNTKRILSHYRHGVKEIKMSENILQKVQELEDFLNDKIDPPEYLLEKYKRRKDQAYRTLLVGLLEDVPQFIFNIAKAKSTAVIMVSISLSAVSFGYKLSMP